MARKLLTALFAVLALALLVGIVSGCGDDENGVIIEPEPEANTVKLRPDRLPTLLEALIYEGWIVKIDEDSNWVESKSLGKFFWNEFDYRFLMPDDITQEMDSVFRLNENVYEYDLIAISLEPHPNDPSPDPSPTVVAEAAIIPDVSTIMRFPATFGTSTEGNFVIGTFSDGNWFEEGDDRSTERHGLWFIKLSTGTGDDVGNETYEKGLTLPVLPSTGYLYEGWAALASGDTLSTGKFYFPDFQDYSAEHSLLQATPNFPGEDFINPDTRPEWVPEDRWPPDMMSGGQAFVTVEPVPDNDPRRPSNLIVLLGNLPVRAPTNSADARKTNFPMGNQAALTFPRVEAVIFQR